MTRWKAPVLAATLVSAVGIVLVALTALALAGCGGSTSGTAGPTQASPTATAAETAGKTLDSCAHEDATTKIIHFSGAGADLDGVVIGHGANGRVLGDADVGDQLAHSRTQGRVIHRDAPADQGAPLDHEALP